MDKKALLSVLESHVAIGISLNCYINNRKAHLTCPSCHHFCNIKAYTTFLSKITNLVVRKDRKLELNGTYDEMLGSHSSHYMIWFYQLR